MTEQRIGNYIIEEPIGRGGMGVVYRGRHEKLPRVVAVKSIDPRVRRDLRRLRHRFEREAFVQSQLDHPSIVKIYDYVLSEQTYHIVMELVEGSSLAELLGRERGRGPGLDRALDLFEQILAAVAYAHCFVYRDEEGQTHRGMVHRDLKPQNILVTRDGRVKVTDFGIVKLTGSSEADTSGLVYGSPYYVSPEQAEGAHVDQRADIYSLGVILYEMLTGAVPFSGERRSEILRAHLERRPRPPSELNPEVGPELERVVLRALEKKPDGRFGTAFEFWKEVRRARGRDTRDIEEQEAALAARAAGEPADTSRIAGVTDELSRSTYATQPMARAQCEECGADADATDPRCRSCGADLRSSPATKGLTSSAVRRARRRALWAGLVAVAAAAAVAAYALFFAGPLAGRDAGNRLGAAPTPDSSPPPAGQVPGPAPAPAPEAGASPLKPSRVTVDSSYDGYNERPLTDGVTDVRQIAAMQYNKGNWASAETPAPHWIQLDFARPVKVSTVYVYWGFDRSRFMPSRRVELQVADGSGGWRKISELESGADHDRAAFPKLAPVEARSLRVLQPAQEGPEPRPFVMWVREVVVYGSEAGAR